MEKHKSFPEFIGLPSKEDGILNTEPACVREAKRYLERSSSRKVPKTKVKPTIDTDLDTHDGKDRLKSNLQHKLSQIRSLKTETLQLMAEPKEK